jgi:hypothetical protein
MFRFILLFTLCSATAYAQSSNAQAEALFREGRDLMAAGKTAEACTSFEGSQKLDPQVTTLLNLAGCREKNGQFATAWGLFLEAERQTRAATDKGTKQLNTVAKTRAQKLESRVSKLTVNVPQASQVDGLEIVRGKENMDATTWNRSLPVDGGTYTVVARAPGSNAWSTEVTIAPEGDTKTIDIPDLRSLPRDVVPPKSPVASAEDQPEELPRAHRSSRVLPITVGVGGVAILGGALALELLGRSTYSDAKAETMDQARRDSLYESANSKHHFAQGFAVAGVACVGVSVWLFLSSRDSSTPPSNTAFVVSPNGIAVTGAF